MKKILVATLAVASVLVLGACDTTGKIGQAYNDAPVSEVNEGEAVLTNMPDGFSNVASKCEGPNMVYVVFKGDSTYASIDVVANDPRCAEG